MMYYGGNDYRDYLAHYGVEGMKWGIRRYQPYSYTGGRKGGKTGKEIGIAGKLGRAAKSVGEAAKSAADLISTRFQTANENRKIKVAERAEQRAAKKEAIEKAERERILNSGDPDLLYKNRNKFTTSELGEAVTRMEKISKLKTAKAEEQLASVERGKKAIAAIADVTKSVSSIYKEVSDLNERSEKKAKEKKEAARKKKVDETIRSGDVNKKIAAIDRGDLSPQEAKDALEVQQKKTALEKIRDSKNDSNNSKNESKSKESSKPSEKTESKQSREETSKSESKESGITLPGDDRYDDRYDWINDKKRWRFQ